MRPPTAQYADSHVCDDVFQVVHEAYTRFTEDPTIQSTWENNTKNTEAWIRLGDFVFLWKLVSLPT